VLFAPPYALLSQNDQPVHQIHWDEEEQSQSANSIAAWQGFAAQHPLFL
jgi:hypothetical protein